jgi:hypothetical protein
LLEEVERARRATVSEEDAPKDSGNVKNVEIVNETTFENEEKDLVMAFNILTLKYKEKRLEERFSAHAGPHSLLIVEIVLSIVSLLLIYIYQNYNINNNGNNYWYKIIFNNNINSFSSNSS